jgi:hypothetical protein
LQDNARQKTTLGNHRNLPMHLKIAPLALALAGSTLAAPAMAEGLL